MRRAREERLQMASLLERTQAQAASTQVHTIQQSAAHQHSTTKHSTTKQNTAQHSTAHAALACSRSLIDVGPTIGVQEALKDEIALQQRKRLDAEGKYETAINKAISEADEMRRLLSEMETERLAEQKKWRDWTKRVATDTSDLKQGLESALEAKQALEEEVRVAQEERTEALADLAGLRVTCEAEREAASERERDGAQAT